ncbi:MAG: Na+:solute symporter [Salinivirgaceae bacterium]|nr:MAG: Na+:solute symporter [Salinivirgaceae bacterium]
MQLQYLDWTILAVFFIIVIGIGWVASRTARKNTSEFFLGGRGMPWWLLGVSMVACTFSADTPNLVTDFVRTSGVAKNWAWWAFLITGMVTVFIYAKLWRRSNVLTDLEFYELRYSGKLASFLRVFRSVYLGLFFNVLIMASVSLAAIKIGAVMFGLSPWVTIVIGSVAVAIYAGIGGLKGVIWADFFQYSIAMFGAVYAAYVALQQPEVGGLDGLLSHPDIQDKLSFIPDFSDTGTLLTLLIIPIAVQWWSVWYPGAEPGGGGYIAQRMLSAKNEKNAIGATLFFNFMHYAIRPWPWIIVALASLIIYPDLASIHNEFGNIAPEYLKHDIAYPAMMSKLGPGWLGLVVASLIAAYMSTIGTHLNWGSSYIVNDFYKRIVKPDASEKELVRIGQLSTLFLMLFSGIIALTVMENAQEAFNILLLSGAGSGAIYLLRWFWWRINALTEIIAMISATVVAIVLIFAIDDTTLTTKYLDAFTVRLLIAVFATTVVWLATTLLTKPEKEETLVNFYQKTRPGGPGWRRIAKKAFPEDTNPTAWAMPIQILNVFVGSITVYAALFGI